MGCCESRKAIDCKFEESLFTPFERKIGLNKYRVSDIDILFSKYSKNSHMSYFQVINIFEELSLPFQDFFDFFDQFDRNRSRIITEKKFSFLQLQSLNVLLCKGELKNKLQFLFSLYDNQQIRVLNRVKIEEMLENLFKVALDYVPNYFLMKSPENDDLQRYQKTVKIGNDVLLDRLSRKILKKKHLVGSEEFIGNILRCFGRDFLSTQFLRQRAFQLAVNGEQVKSRKAKRKLTNESNEQWLDDFSDVSNDFVTNFESRKLKHKKSISNFYPRITYYFSEDGIDDDQKKFKTETIYKSNESTPTQNKYGGRTSISKNFTVVSHIIRDQLTEIKSESEELNSPTGDFKMIRRESERNYLSAVSEEIESNVRFEAANRLSVRYRKM
jgi:hypothetical protein